MFCLISHSDLKRILENGNGSQHKEESKGAKSGSCYDLAEMRIRSAPRHAGSWPQNSSIEDLSSLEAFHLHCPSQSAKDYFAPHYHHRSCQPVRGLPQLHFGGL